MSLLPFLVLPVTSVSSKCPLTTTCDPLFPKCPRMAIPTAAQRQVCYKTALALVMTIRELPAAFQATGG